MHRSRYVSTYRHTKSVPRVERVSAPWVGPPFLTRIRHTDPSRSEESPGCGNVIGVRKNVLNFRLCRRAIFVPTDNTCHLLAHAA